MYMYNIYMGISFGILAEILILCELESCTYENHLH